MRGDARDECAIGECEDEEEEEADERRGREHLEVAPRVEADDHRRHEQRERHLHRNSSRLLYFTRSFNSKAASKACAHLAQSAREQRHVLRDALVRIIERRSGTRGAEHVVVVVAPHVLSLQQAAHAQAPRGSNQLTEPRLGGHNLQR